MYFPKLNSLLAMNVFVTSIADFMSVALLICLYRSFGIPDLQVFLPGMYVSIQKEDYSSMKIITFK